MIVFGLLLLALTVQSIDYITDKYHLTCFKNGFPAPFSYQISLGEWDLVKNDLIAFNQGKGVGTVQDAMSGTDNGDGFMDDWYEHLVKISHNC